MHIRIHTLLPHLISLYPHSLYLFHLVCIRRMYTFFVVTVLSGRVIFLASPVQYNDKDVCYF